MEIVQTCPLGAKCEDARDGRLYRCRWWIQVAGQDPQTGARIDRWDCAMVWLPVLTVEVGRVGRGQAAAIESFRNGVLEGQAQTLRIMSIRADRNAGDPRLPIAPEPG